MSVSRFIAVIPVCTLLMTFAATARADQVVPAKQAPAGKTFEVTVKKNIVYRNLEKGELPVTNRLDLYLPDDAKDFPVVMLVHGGAWVAGDKGLDYIPEIARSFASQGIGVVAPNYRLAPFFQHPAHMNDIAKAFAWTQKHVGKHGGRADQLFLLGHSAGGHLVSLLATDESYLKQVGLARQNIKGVVSISGVYQVSDVTFNVLVKNPQMRMDFAMNAANPFNMVFGKDAETAKQASPLTHVQEGLPPFLIVYAEKELPSLSEMAEKFDAALREKKCQSQLVKVAERNHVTVLWNAREGEDRVAKLVREFVEKQRRKE